MCSRSFFEVLRISEIAITLFISLSGITPLHIAVVNQNLNLVHHLISRGGDVINPRVTGLYFRKRIGGLLYCGKSAQSQNNNIPGMQISFWYFLVSVQNKLLCFCHVIKKQKSFGVFLRISDCSTGEHILSFAVCAGNEEIISMLIDAGASTRVQDYLGMK